MGRCLGLLLLWAGLLGLLLWTLGALRGSRVAGLGLCPGWSLGARLLGRLARRALLLGVRRVAGLGGRCLGVRWLRLGRPLGGAW